MDPLALAAVVGLVFAGKRISEGATPEPDAQPATTKPVRPITRRDVDLMVYPAEHAADAFDLRNTNPQLGRRIGDWRIRPKEAVGNLQDVSKYATRFPYGQPVYDMVNRQYVTNKMNNLSPLEQPMNVGPGLGLGPNVAAGGGFHDYFRALPTNINEERLTTLEGRDGPPDPVVKSGVPLIGAISKDAKAIKAWDRKPAAYGGQGQGGALVGAEGRPDFIKTRKTTIRQETGMRTDTLSSGPAQYNVYQPYATGKESYTDKSLTRVSGYRSKDDRAGNAGSMNVRNDPVNQVGAATNLRVEAKPVPPGPMGPTGSSNSRGYKAPEYDDPLNEHKSKPNPLAQPAALDIAIQQLEKNPIALPPLAVS